MQCSTDQRLQELQALGYGSESDYQAHSTLMQASANLAKKQIADSIAAGSTAFPHQGASNATALPAPFRALLCSHRRSQGRSLSP